MIKFFCIIFLLQLILFECNAQKEDYFWIFGYDNSPPVGNNETYFFDFNVGSSPKGEAGLSPLWIRGNNASICDKEGNLLFYTNGCHIADRINEIMPNGSGINAGNYLEEFRQDTCAHYPGTQDVLILPDPGNINGYYMLHKTVEYNGDFFMDNIKYTYVDISLNGGTGDVTEKNVDIFSEDKLILQNYFTAIRHLNGSDWWIIQPDEEGNFITIILDESGFNVEAIQPSGIQFHPNASAAGTAKFSPDGTKYVYFNTDDNVLLYDYDRSNGLLSNMRTIDIRPGGSLAVFTAIEFSPNSRFVYFSAVDELYQLDTWEQELEDGLILIDTWNGVQDPFNTIFYLMALAPDCKIYMCSGSGTFSYHVINKPNEKGPACDFVQQGIRLPFVSASATMPNFPRFRVDEDDKCDPTITSIFGDHVYYRRDMTVYPNPVRDVLTVEIPEGKEGKIVVFDIQGQLVWSDSDYDSYKDKVQINLSGLAVGSYSIEFLPEGNMKRLVYTSQVVRVE